VSIFGEYAKEIGVEFGISERVVYVRFKSIYGDSPRNVIKKRVMPTKSVLDQIVIDSDSSEEVKKTLGLSHNLYVGLYDTYYGVSTFQKAKLKILEEKYQTSYSPVREDNRSLIYSQLLGDGSYDARRHALTITHGHKQGGYLKWKVSLINKAYPKTATSVRLRMHTQGHQYFYYYTNLGNLDILPEVECVDKLTNLGWLLWFLDDGSYGQNISICCKRSDETRAEAIRVLATFGIKARDNGVSIVMAGQENDLKFYFNFIKPFIKDIPICMQYKVEDIVEGLGMSYQDQVR
jgi:hypothetical protein